MASLVGRLALVTGSTGGIGLGIAQALASRGCDIILHGFGDDRTIQKTKQLILSYNVCCHWEGTDLSDVASIREMTESLVRAFPRSPDILINNAGFQSVADITQFSLETWQKMLAVQLTAPFLLIQHYLPHMVQQGWGRIINISSVHGLIASPYKCAYVSAKHGLIGLTKVVALEAAKTGVTCNAVCPGWVETSIFTEQVKARSKEHGVSYEEAKRQMVSVHPTEQPVKIDDVGELVSFLCTEAASQMTGTSLVMDGGWTTR